MLNEVKSFIKENDLIEPKAKIVLAFSYGVDSRVLLDVLIKLGYEVIIAHVNHKHRAQSEIEEKEAIALALRLNIKYEVMHLVEDYNQNFHADAHNKRYDFFMSVANKYNAKYIATAHHLNDNAETILLNLIRGSNLYGYGGINIKQKRNNITIVRPLMCATKKEIKEYQENNMLSFYEDSSNSEDEFRRNRIRHHILPLMEEENPSLLAELYNYSSMMHEAFSFIRSISISYLNDHQDIIDIPSFKELDIAIKKDIISLLLEKREIERSYNLINLILTNIMDKDPQADISLKGGLLFKKRYNKAFIETRENPKQNYHKLYENNVISTQNFRFYFTKNLANSSANYIKLCYNDLVFPLILRNRQDGDTIEMTYGHKKIKKLFMDLHLTKEQRDKALILENNGEILWVVGYAKSKRLTQMKSSGDIYLVYEVL